MSIIRFNRKHQALPILLGAVVLIGAILGYGLRDASGSQVLERGDLNCDGAVNALDAIPLLRYDAGLSPQLPDGCDPIASVTATPLGTIYASPTPSLAPAWFQCWVVEAAYYLLDPSFDSSDFCVVGQARVSGMPCSPIGDGWGSSHCSNGEESVNCVSTDGVELSCTGYRGVPSYDCTKGLAPNQTPQVVCSPQASELPEYDCEAAGDAVHCDTDLQPVQGVSCDITFDDTHQPPHALFDCLVVQ
jgi:hypothetical protein